jgi:UDP-glucose 4-epimerase
MNCNIVVTGASGFVGRALMMELLNNGLPVIGLSRKKMSGFVTVDSYSDLPEPDGAVLVHLAQGHDASDSFRVEDIEVCRKLSKKPWRHIVYASSAMVYGDNKEHPRSPDEPVLVTSDYVREKIACEEIVSGVGGTCLRFTNLYGPRMSANNVISDILRQIPGEGPLRLRDVKPVRDFLWIEDAAQCLVAACEVMPGSILNAGSDCGMAVGDVAQLALELAGQRLRTVVGLASSGEASCIKLDISKTRSVLNWVPKVDISTGLFSLLSTNKNDK